MRGRLRLSLIFMGAVIGLMAAGPAWAHTATVHYAPVWSTAQRGAVTIYNDSTVTGSFFNRVIGGAVTWDRVGTSFNYTYKGSANLSKNVCDTASRGKNLLYKAPFDGAGKTAAVTETCFTSTNIVRFTMRFDSAEKWHTSTSTTVPRGYLDLSSVATHEFGHATGWRSHVSESALCAYGSGQQTMCPSTYSGTSYQRSLGSHDKHTFDAAY